VGGNAKLASFLIVQRARIEARMAERLGPAAPHPGAPESELLRRFRSFAAAALRLGEAAEPALEGLRVHERRAEALLDAWTSAAAELAPADAGALRSALDPLLKHFRGAMRQTGGGRRARGAARTRRRAVMAAIDRVADSFLAVDADTGQIVDANPAAGSLLGLARDALLGVDAMSFVPEERRATWWTEFDAMSEGAEPRRFASQLCDASGREIPVDCSMTRFATRSRTLALVIARPQ
jgi:PAS domain S-box-containing protein